MISIRLQIPTLSPKNQKNRNQAGRSDTQILHKHRNFALSDLTADTTPRRTAPSLTWSQLEPSRHHKDDTRSEAEILLPLYRKIHLKMG